MAAPTTQQVEHLDNQMRSLRYALMNTLDAHLDGEMTINNIIDSIDKGVGSQYVIALQQLQLQANGTQQSLYSILPDEVAKAIEKYTRRT